jgi:hypothetical protein
MSKLALLAPYLEILVEGKRCLASKALQWLADSVESNDDNRLLMPVNCTEFAIHYRSKKIFVTNFKRVELKVANVTKYAYSGPQIHLNAMFQIQSMN